MQSYWFSKQSKINIIYNISVITITITMSIILANFGKYAISDCPFINMFWFTCASTDGNLQSFALLYFHIIEIYVSQNQTNTSKIFKHLICYRIFSFLLKGASLSEHHKLHWSSCSGGSMGNCWFKHLPLELLLQKVFTKKDVYVHILHITAQQLLMQ